MNFKFHGARDTFLTSPGLLSMFGKHLGSPIFIILSGPMY